MDDGPEAIAQDPGGGFRTEDTGNAESKVWKEGLREWAVRSKRWKRREIQVRYKFPYLNASSLN